MVNTMFIEVGSLSSHNADSFVGCEFFFFFRIKRKYVF